MRVVSGLLRWLDARFGGLRAVACAQRTEAPMAAVGGAFRVAAPPDHQVPSEEGPTGGFRRRRLCRQFFIAIELASCHSTAEAGMLS